MRMIIIEERSPGRYRLANGPMTVEVFGDSVEDVLWKAGRKAAVHGRHAYEVIDTVMGEPLTMSLMDKERMRP